MLAKLRIIVEDNSNQTLVKKEKRHPTTGST